MLGGEEPAQKKLHPTVGGKALRKEFLTARKLRRPKSTDWGPWFFMKSTGSKRAQSSSSGNVPSQS